MKRHIHIEQKKFSLIFTFVETFFLSVTVLQNFDLMHSTIYLITLILLIMT